jgi:penicillin-insensitive murein endopeptidase
VCLVFASALAASAGVAQTDSTSDSTSTSTSTSDSTSTSTSTATTPSRPRTHARPHTKATGTPRTHTKAHATTRTRAHTKAAATRTPVDPGDGTSLSVGRHNRGRLMRAHALTQSDTLRFKSPQSDTHWGTDELVALLERASRRVAERTPGARLTVGDLSQHRGGRFRPHRSHQSGRDVDVGFYVTNAEGTPVDLDRFVTWRRSMTAAGRDDLRYDLVRNWQLVEALVTDEVLVQWIFVSRDLRTQLLAEGARQGASADTLARAELVLSQPSRGGRHADHFHVRIYCPPGDTPRCVDDPPFHPWTPRGAAMAAAHPSAPPAAETPPPDED